MRGILLDVTVDADPQIPSRHRLYPAFPRCVYLDSFGIRHSQNHTGFSLQCFLIDHFQSNDPLIVPSGKSQDFTGQVPIRIVSLIILIHFHPRQIIFPDSVTDALVHIAFDAFHGRIFFHTFSRFRLRNSQLFYQHGYHLFRFCDLIMNHRYGTDRLVIRQYHSVPVQNTASCRLYAAFSLMQSRRRFLIIIRPPHHQIQKSHKQSDKHQCAYEKNGHDLFAMKKSILLIRHKKTSQQELFTFYCSCCEAIHMFCLFILLIQQIIVNGTVTHSIVPADIRSRNGID